MNSKDDISSIPDRHELKYLIPEKMVLPITDFISIYCRPDAYSETTATGNYPIFSLYLDSPNYIFLRSRQQGSENRFNMRIRTYNQEATSPCFLEIKQKRNGIVRKFRSQVKSDNWAAILDNPTNILEDCRSPQKAELFGGFDNLLEC